MGAQTRTDVLPYTYISLIPVFGYLWPGTSTRNFLTFVNTTAIACHQNPEALVVFLPVCNSSRVYKRQKITSTVLEYA